MLAGLLDIDAGSHPIVACDSFFANAVLLLGFEDGADGTTVVVDESPAAHGAAGVVGNAQIDTAQKKFGNSSGLFDGSGDRFEWGASPTWPLGNSWTIECFVQFNATTSDQCLMSQFIGALTGECWMIRTQPTASLEFFTYDGTSFIADIVSATSIYTTGVWYHLAVDANGTKVRLYLNGVMIGSSIPTYTHTGQAATTLTVGSDGLGGRSFNGWLDEIRITAGVARYNSDSGFTPPTAAFPRVSC